MSLSIQSPKTGRGQKEGPKKKKCKKGAYQNM